jgi:hypothetical protein
MIDSEEFLQKDAPVVLSAPSGPRLIDKANDDAGVQFSIPKPDLPGEPELLEGVLLIKSHTEVVFWVACTSGRNFEMHNSKATVITTRPGAFARHVQLPKLGLKNGTGSISVFYRIPTLGILSESYQVMLSFPG